MKFADGAVRPDILFPTARVAVFVDGCFWHGCPEHGEFPVANADFWREKIESTRIRDSVQAARLEDAGWTVVRVWEHEEPTAAADRIAAVVNRRRKLNSDPS
jgi:DNA mismatch endonuclease (patch repair protein)